MSAPEGRLLVARGKPGYGASKPSVYLAAPGREDVLEIRNADDPAVSQRGRMLAFARSGIWVSDLRGKAPRRLTRNEGDGAPAWSADDRTIFFARYDRTANVTAIFSVVVSTRRIRKLTHPVQWGHGPCHWSPAPSPDGRLVAYTDTSDCDHGVGSAIVGITPAGRKVAFFTRFNGPGDAGDPAWSPDGKSLVFSSLDVNSGGDTSLYVSRSDGSAARRVVHGGSPSEPVWSPDGRWIAFVREVSTPSGNAWKGQIWLVRPDGSGRHFVRGGPESYTSPTWILSR